MRAARADEEPVVSVMMFVYNQAAFVGKSIRSVIGQQGDFPAEVIIHDDASTDGSQDIIRHYAEKYPDIIIPILQEENQMGQGVDFVSRYIMPRVRGKYIAYCEGDDYWTDAHKLSRQIKVLDGHPDYSGVCHNCVIVDRSGHIQKPIKKFYPFRKDYVYRLKDLTYEGRMPGQTATVMMRSSLVNGLDDEVKKQFREIRHCVGDRKRTLLMLLSGNVLCLKRPMSAYRYVTEGGSSWNAQVRGKNLAGRYFVQELDFRRFAQSCFGTELHNDYVLFGTGLMACLRVFRSPTEENVRQYEMVVDAVGGRRKLARFLLARFPRAVLTLPQKFMQELRWRVG